MKFTSKLVHVLAFGTPKFYIAPYDRIKHELVNLSSNCDVKSGLSMAIKWLIFTIASAIRAVWSIEAHCILGTAYERRS